MGRPKGSTNKSKINVTEPIKEVKSIADDILGSVVKSVKKAEDVISKVNVTEQVNHRTPRLNVRGEFQKLVNATGPVNSAVFECADGHGTIGASNYVQVPCRICGMESILKEIKKGVIQ